MKILSTLVATLFAGTLAASAQQYITVAPKHRYSFGNASGALGDGTQVTDSIGTAHGVVRGTGASADGSGIRLLGGSSASAAYIDLPNASVSGSAEIFPGYAEASYEVWVTVHSTQNWSRILDFGNNEIDEVTSPGGTFNGADYLIVTANIGTSNDIRFERGGQYLTGGGIQDVAGGTTIGTQMHLVATYDTASSAWKLYKDGTLISTVPTLLGPSTLDDLNVWLGRSNWSADSNIDATYDELRIYDYALNAQQVLGNYESGPDVLNSDSLVAQAPLFASDPLVKPAGIVGTPYTGSLAADAFDPNPADTVTFSMTSGPGWLTVAPDGTLSGTPTAGSEGLNAFTVRAEDPGGMYSEATLNITVTPQGTVAFWNFEDGVDGQSFTPAGNPDGSGGSLDSASDVLMRGFNDYWGPTWTSAVAPNGDGLAMNNADYHQDAYVTEGALHGWSPNAWTIECTVNLADLAGWNTVIGRDGSTQAEAEADFYLQNNGVDDHYRVNLDTVGGQRWVLDGNYPIAANTWYAIAVMSDGVTLSMWLDDGNGYQQIGSLDISAQSVDDNALPGSALSWTFGRGWFDGGFVDRIAGRMDNIRFSNGALAPEDLIPLLPPPPAPTGLVASAASDSQIDLSWAATPNAASYTVKRSASSGGPFSTIASGVTGTGFNDSGLLINTTYYYVVTAENAASASGAESAEASASTWTPAETWRFAHFGTTANAGDAADDADPEGDGVSNLLERAFVGDPNVSDRSVLPYIDEGSTRLTIVYRKSLAATDLNILVQESSDPSGGWSPAAGTGTVFQDDGTVQTIYFTRPAASESQLFLRVQVTGP